MCGISGIFDTRGHRRIDRELLRRMTDTIAHRGPDEAGLWTEPGIGLGHRRLAIIDLSSGQQPMVTSDGQVIVSFNGEIYNYKETRALLLDCGYQFRTNSDTEVILYAWMEWGEACLQHFRGMFAFAVFDRRTETLFLARDRLGVKPLHYAVLPDGVVIFGSELKALLPYPGLPRTIDEQAVEDYFAYGYVPDPRTILRGVRKLPAGHSLTLRRGRPVPDPRQYWDISFEHQHTGSPEELGEELIERLREAVKIRMISEVPLGAFLSGGVDSSAIVAMMAGLSNEPVNTCSIGFDAAGYDESGYAEQLARRYATRHRSRVVSSDDFSLIERLALAYDEPFADASALPTYRVCELARENVTVALSGDGGDEILAGYRRHRFHANEERFRSMLPLRLRRSLFGFLGQVWPKMDWAPRPLRAKTTFQSLGLTTAEAYFNSIAVVRDDERRRLFSDEFRRALQGYRASDIYRDVMAKAPAKDPLSQAQYADLKVWLPGDILTKMDRASMAVSLEAREPLLDHQLLEWAAGLAPNLRIRGGQGKWLFKKALEPYVPHDLLYRPKMGFVVPIDRWFRGPLAETALSLASSATVTETGWFDPAFIEQAAQDHIRGLRDNSRLLWQLLMFDLSLKHLVNQPAAAGV